MNISLRKKIETINDHLAILLADARHALTGEKEFGVEQVRQLSAPVGEMAPVIAQNQQLRRLHPELIEPLDRYRSQIGDLHITLQQVYMMLLARRSQMEAGRVHVDAVSQWARVLSQTR